MRCVLGCSALWTQSHTPSSPPPPPPCCRPDKGAAWAPAAPLPRVRASLAGAWRLAKLLVQDGRQLMDLCVLHVPPQQVAALKATAAAANPAVTTGDAVQAAAALLLHAATEQPLLPCAPRAMVALVQLPTPPGHFGNAVHMLRVKLPEGTPQPAAGDWAGALAALAGAIRGATAAFRAEPVSRWVEYLFRPCCAHVPPASSTTDSA